MNDVQVDTPARPAAKVELIETLFGVPVWLCEAGLGCVCGECEEEDEDDA